METVDLSTDPRMAAGIALIERGWYVFVLGRDKVPLASCNACPRHGAYEDDGVTRHDAEVCDHLVCHGFYAATRDQTRLAAMLAFADQAGGGGILAVRTGAASRLAVIDAEGDADPKSGLTGVDVVDRWREWNGFDLPPTLMARTPSGGLHLYYQLPEGLVVRSPGRVLPKVDFKAEGGYVAVPPSEGRTWVNPEARPVLADGAVVAWMVGARGRRNGQNGSGGGSGGEHVPGEPLGTPDGYDYQELCANGCPAGVRDTFANDMAFRLRTAGVPRSYAELSARVMWERMEQPPGHEFTWDQMLGKLDHVWETVEPESIGSVGALLAENETDAVADSVAALLASGQEIDLGAELTQTGIALRFAERFRGRFLYVPGLGWHGWDGTCWQYDELNESFRATQTTLLELHAEARAASPEVQRKWAQFIQSASSMAGRASMLTGAAVEPGVKATVRNLNADPYLLVVKNGTIDLKTRVLRGSEPQDHNTRCAEVIYDPYAVCPKWREHVRLVSAHPDGSPDPHMEAYLQRWAGYTLTGLVSEQRFFFGFGEGANGKNVLIETLVGLLGSYAKRGSTKIILGGTQEHETVIADLAGARMVFIDETPQGKINEARLKELTGTARISARKIAKDPFEFEATFKIWMAGNNRPRVSDTSEGFWRRMDLVPFDAVIPAHRRVKDYTRVLAEERPGILNWALEGLGSHLELGLAQPQRVLDAVQEYRDEEDVFKAFVDDTFHVHAPSIEWVWHPNSVLRGLYERWCEENGVRPMSMRSLSSDWHRNRFETDDKPRKIRMVAFSAAWKSQRGRKGPPLLEELPAELQWTGGGVA